MGFVTRDAVSPVAATSDGDVTTLRPETCVCKLCVRCVCTDVQVAYELFTALGFFSAFQIPVRQFVAYFHVLELGYRHNPCKPRSCLHDTVRPCLQLK